MLREERAIVTNIPGTTRDFIEEKIAISGVLFRIIDTAGLRNTDDSIEQEGVKKTWKVIETSDVIVMVHDSTNSLTNEELVFLKHIRKNFPQLYLLIANNKKDLKERKSISKVEIEGNLVIETSALSHEGIEPLKNELEKFVLDKSKIENRESVTITNERHYAALLRAKDGLSSSLESLKLQESGEFIALDLRRAIDAIGEIIGLITTEEILNDIFSKFCIGK
jgi:tRNA modification GTPase